MYDGNFVSFDVGNFSFSSFCWNQERKTEKCTFNNYAAIAPLAFLIFSQCVSRLCLCTEKWTFFHCIIPKIIRERAPHCCFLCPFLITVNYSRYAKMESQSKKKANCYNQLHSFQNFAAFSLFFIFSVTIFPNFFFAWESKVEQNRNVNSANFAHKLNKMRCVQTNVFKFRLLFKNPLQMIEDF